MDEHPSAIGPKGVLEEQVRAPVVSAGSECEGRSKPVALDGRNL
jgi:hypothetical protein